MLYSVVVVGSGVVAGLAAATPVARLAAGPAVSAASAPRERRLARELAGTKRSSAARRRARERPSDRSHGSSSARSRAAAVRLRASSIAARDMLEVGEAWAAVRAVVHCGAGRPPRAVCWRRSRERISESSQGSSTARSRGNPDIKRRPFSLLLAPTGLAVGLAHFALRHNIVAIRPRNLNGCIGSPVPRPRGVEDSARTGGNLTELLARCVTQGGLQDFLPTGAPTVRRGCAHIRDRCDPHWAFASYAFLMPCTHLDHVLITELPEETDGCEDCLQRRPVAAPEDLPGVRKSRLLRRLAQPSRDRARRASGHPIIRSIEPGEAWSWCYLDEVMMNIPEVRGETRIPPSPLAEGQGAPDADGVQERGGSGDVW